MRFLLYNVAYCTGPPAGHFHAMLTLHRYLHCSPRHVEQIARQIAALDPDVVGLVEVDLGSRRAGCCNQVAVIARELLHEDQHSAGKYGHKSWWRFVPLMRYQGNAILARNGLRAGVSHFLLHGVKRLVVEVDVQGVRILLVHLALAHRVRNRQLEHLAQLIGSRSAPVVVAGDFNAFGGEPELEPFLQATGLVNPNRQHQATYPVWQPRHELDFVLCSPNIKVTSFQVLENIRLSDHFPVMLEFDLPESSSHSPQPCVGAQ